MSVNPNKYIPLIIFSLCIFCLGPVHAEETERFLTIDDALKYAYKSNPDIIAARKNVDIASAEHSQTKRYSNPELEFEISKIPSDLDGERTLNSESLEGEARLIQPLRLWGKRKLSIGIAEDEIKQSEYELQILMTDISRQVKARYTESLLYQKSIGLARDNLERAQRLLEQVNIMFNVGKARNHELVRAKLEVANAKNDVFETETDFYVSVGNLNLLLGLNMSEKITLEDVLTLKKMEQNQEVLFQLALSQRADLLKQGQEIDKKDKEIKLAKRQRLPDVNLGVFVEREEEIYNAGAGISFEFPLWNQYQDDIAKAFLEKEIAENSLNALKREVELDVYTAFKRVDLAQRSVRNLEQSIKEANELLRIITIEYEEGEVSFLSYLDGLSSYKETKQNYLESLANYVNRLAVLEQAVGGSLVREEQ